MVVLFCASLFLISPLSICLSPLLPAREGLPPCILSTPVKTWACCLRSSPLSAQPFWRQLRLHCAGLICWHFVLMKCSPISVSHSAQHLSEATWGMKATATCRGQQFDQIRQPHCSSLEHMAYFPFSLSYFLTKFFFFFSVAAVTLTVWRSSMILMGTAVSRRVSLTVITDAFKALPVCLTQPLSSSQIVFQVPFGIIEGL